MSEALTLRAMTMLEIEATVEETLRGTLAPL